MGIYPVPTMGRKRRRVGSERLVIECWQQALGLRRVLTLGVPQQVALHQAQQFYRRNENTRPAGRPLIKVPNLAARVHVFGTVGPPVAQGRVGSSTPSAARAYRYMHRAWLPRAGVHARKGPFDGPCSCRQRAVTRRGGQLCCRLLGRDRVLATLLGRRLLGGRYLAVPLRWFHVNSANHAGGLFSRRGGRSL